MAAIELSRTLKALKQERVRMHQDVAKLDKAIVALEGLFGSDAATPNGNTGKRTLSAAVRRKIGKAQKLRWARLKQQPGKK